MKIQQSQRSLHLPEDIIEEILSRLDVKSLLRFRCLSKSYRSLIDSKRFIKTHLQKSTKDTTLAHHRVLLLSDIDCPEAKVSGCSLLSFLDNNSDINASELKIPTNVPSYSEIAFAGCCNGLVCIMLEINQNSEQFILWNPSTRISKILPDIVKDKMGSSEFIDGLGLGWDESSDDYKVVAIVSVENQIVCRIYSLKTESWKQINFCDIGDHQHWYCEVGKLASGKLHWDRYSMRQSDRNEVEIFAFDVKREVFDIVEQPSYSGGVITYQCMGTFGECLAVLCCYKNGAEQIWAMKEYGVKESWEKVMVLQNDDSVWTSPSVSAFYNGEEGEIILMNLGSRTKYLAYDMKNARFHHDRDVSESDIYIESLVSPL